MSELRLQADELEKVVAQLCATKVEEFQLYGYEHVTGEEIWQCVSASYGESLPPLHRLTNDILSLKVTAFMNWMTVNAYKGIDLD